MEIGLLPNKALQTTPLRSLERGCFSHVRTALTPVMFTFRGASEYRKIPLRFIDVALDDAVTLAAQLAIYAYDAYVIACARTQAVPLITLDNGLRVAAQAAGLTIVEVTP